jgi:hypothetical protein
LPAFPAGLTLVGKAKSKSKEAGAERLSLWQTLIFLSKAGGDKLDLGVELIKLFRRKFTHFCG